MELDKLAAPFDPREIEWRVGQAGMRGDKVWAKVLAYVTNSAIMDRLDAVCGPGFWKNEFRYEPSGAVLCGLSIRIGDEWVTKWDGAEETDIEKVKGGLSNAMKRAAVQWGIGRYLYDLEEGWAVVSEDGQYYQAKSEKKNTPAFRWNPPKLPAWALPSDSAPLVDRETGEITEKPKAKPVTLEGKPLKDHTTERLVKAAEYFADKPDKQKLREAIQVELDSRNP